MNGANALAGELYDTHDSSRTRRWFEELAKIETPHKRYTDLGRGLMALAVGLGLAWRLTWKYERKSQDEKWAYLRLAWFGLWLLRMPLIMTYYVLRTLRHDYPPWGDSIAIPIFSGWISMIVGHEVSVRILRRDLRGYSLPEKIRWRRSMGGWGHTRFALVALWLVGLFWLVVWGVMDGDEGLVIACTGVVPLLLAFLWSGPKLCEMVMVTDADSVHVAQV